MLPHVDNEVACTPELVDGYRSLMEATLRAARRYQQCTDPRLITTREALRRDAKAAKAAWQVVHLYLTALLLADLYAGGAEGDPLELVLLAEQTAEELAIDVEAQ